MAPYDVLENQIPCFLNDQAGRARAAAEQIAADQRFRLIKCDPSDLREAIRTAVSEGTHRVVLAGADGTIAAAAALLVGTSTELALVPGGTLNHFARRLGIPADTGKALEIAATFQSRPVNVGYVNDRLFLNSSSLGAYVDYVHARERLEPWCGYYAASILAVFGGLARLPIYTVDVESEGERRRYQTPLVFIGVDERGLKFPALGDPVAGGRSGLHALVLKGGSRTRVVYVALDAVARGLKMAARTPYLESFVVDRCTIELPLARPHVAIDGETIRLTTPLHYRIRRDDLNVVAPEPDHN